MDEREIKQEETEEVVLRKKRRLDTLKQIRQEKQPFRKRNKRIVGGEKGVRIVRPEHLLRKKRIRDGSRKRYERKERETNRRSHLQEADYREGDVVIVIKLHQARHASGKIKAKLRSLGLTRQHSASFLRMDSFAVLQQLVALSDYVVFGYPDATLIENLIRLRGRGRVQVQLEGEQEEQEEENKDSDEEEEEEEEEEKEISYNILPIQDNNMIEDQLEEHGLLCIEDLVHYLSPKETTESLTDEEDNKKSKKSKSKQKRKRGEEEEKDISEEEQERAQMQSVILSFLATFELKSPLSRLQCKTLRMQLPREEAHGYLSLEHLRSLLGKMM